MSYSREAPATRAYFNKGKRYCEDRCRCARKPVTLTFTKFCCGDERLNRNLFIETMQNSPNSFITTWRTTGLNEEIQLPVGGEVDFYVLWGDGSFNKITSSADPVTHTYAAPGDYNVVVFGKVNTWDNNVIPDIQRSKLIDVVQFGKVGLTWLNFLRNSIITTFSASDVPDTTITNMASMFSEAINANPDVSNWDVSNVTNMAFMFNLTTANPDVSKWDVSNVTTMVRMFNNATNANPDVSNWDVSSVTDMEFMFSQASSANPDVSNWDVSKVTNMRRMFNQANVANPNVTIWNTSSVTNMERMFSQAPVANPNVTNWNVSNVQDMEFMFNQALSVDRDLSLWLPTSVVSLDNFMRNSGFTQDNYNRALIMFDSNTTIQNVQWQAPTARSAIDIGFQLDGSAGTPDATTAYSNLIGKSWTIA